MSDALIRASKVTGRAPLTPLRVGSAQSLTRLRNLPNQLAADKTLAKPFDACPNKTRGSPAICRGERRAASKIFLLPHTDM
ncbi:MAG: hypothetical protein M2R45_03754 [Verrucomicrobia subdivision 3 bacterium]|nr:hypothetical protein [Limisphaerales bacterium]MCS1416922.1 hypothetical protein [Limisphaerales bacterium]